jgi:KaiC/GvpD/RAD55 family RecA-like ATPase
VAEDSTVQDRLPFSEAKQRALLGHLLVNDRFFLQARSKLEPSWFIDSYASKVLAAKIGFFNKFQRIPSDPELRETPALLDEEKAVRDRCYKTMTLAQHETNFFGLDALAPELTDWLKARLYAKHIDRSAKLFNSQKLPEAYAEIREVTNQISEIRFENDQEVSFENYKMFFETQETGHQHCLTFGLGLMDKLLLPNGVNGSLLRGDTTILLAPTNIGKTTTMINIAIRNIKRAKSVLFLTHEGRPEDIQEKFWCNILNVPKAGLYTLYKDAAGQAYLDSKLRYLSAYLTYIPYNKAGGEVEDVEEIIRRKQEERIAKTGKGYDLLVCDYPAKLTTRQAKHGNLQFRHIENIIYNTFVQLALEYNFHALLAIQTNRTGSKKNRGHKSKWEDTGEASRLLTMEDVAESWGPMTTATNVISINRDERAMAKNRVTFYVCKSRSSEVGWAVVCRSNFANAITHSEDLGGTFYRSSHTMSEKIDDLLMQHLGMEIPYPTVAKAIE